jgi:endonuclease-3
MILTSKNDTGKEFNRNRLARIIRILSRVFPDVKIPIRFSNPFELLIATILSAQCTDAKVNQVTESLFKKYPSPRSYVEADLETLQEDIRPTGFYRNKAKAIRQCCRKLISDFGGEVPRSLDELVTLPGVGRKTANAVLGNAFHIPGITVDRHVQRVSHRIGLTKNQDPTRVEYDLMKITPKSEWIHLSILFTWHGRNICLARNPLCPTCPILKLCKYGAQRVLGKPPRI